MIKTVRVDHRLIHGQVAFTWTKFLGIDLILIPSNSVIHDQLRINLLRMAKPESVGKLIIKSVKESADAIKSGVTDKYSMMILCESINDAYELIKQTPEIKSLNIGGTKREEDSRQISKAVHLSDEDLKKVQDLIASGVDCYMQMVPDDEKMPIAPLL